jgi:hypothetical protein
MHLSSHTRPNTFIQMNPSESAPLVCSALSPELFFTLLSGTFAQPPKEFDETPHVVGAPRRFGGARCKPSCGAESLYLA